MATPKNPSETPPPAWFIQLVGTMFTLIPLMIMCLGFLFSVIYIRLGYLLQNQRNATECIVYS
ncbi:MAG: hypothetical protein SFY68_02450, partial [Candidatus Sumerlaeia bacterium]|nr:hypothetical protein [Candidatus Sumerlaeia bacterium]